MPKPFPITIEQIFEDYENQLDLLEYRTRKRILVRVLSYLSFTYPRETKLVNTAEHYALKIVSDRIMYNHHYTYNF